MPVSIFLVQSMPGRQYTGLRGPKDERQQKSKRSRKTSHSLGALTIAEQQFPEKNKIRKHRLGEFDRDLFERKHDGTHSRDDAEGRDTKRRRTADDETWEDDAGSDSEGNRWQIGQVNSDNDSELDSDEAFGSSDEERFESFTFRGSTKSQMKRVSKSQKKAHELDPPEDIHDGEESEDPENDLGDDAVDLATAWDLNVHTDNEPPKNERLTPGSGKTPVTPHQYTDIVVANDNSDSDEGSDLLPSDIEPEDKAETRSGLKKLRKFVDAMEMETADKHPPQRDHGQENGTPTDFGLTSVHKLTITDLIPSITDSRLKTSLKNLDSANKNKSLVTSGKLSAPLAKRQQDRLDRAAAYEKSKETLDRWIDTVRANRQAEHLSFPLVDPSAQHMPRLGTIKPQTDLESTIQTILAQSGLGGSNEPSLEDRITASEEMHTKKLTIEEARARTAELRKRRDLLFREEIRAKRVSKIKSKAYRRVHRKEREKMEVAERQALLEAGMDLDEEEKERLDRRRAEARIGIKHKESKWAKSLKQTGRAAWDEEARASQTEMAQRDHELQQRMEGKRVKDFDGNSLVSSSLDSDDDEDPWAEKDERTERAKLHQMLDDLERENDNLPVLGPHSKLLSMKFMQNADSAKRLHTTKEIKQLRQEIDGEQSANQGHCEDGGRRKFGSTKVGSGKKHPTSPPNEFEEPLGSDDEESHITQSTLDLKPGPSSKQSQPPPLIPFKLNSYPSAVTAPEPVEPVDNPWLKQSSRKDKKHREANVDRTVDITTYGNKESPDHTNTRGKGDTYTQHENDRRNVKTASNTNGNNDRLPQLVGAEDHNTDSINEENMPILLNNHDLVQMAFAGDEVVADFEKEKKETVEDEGDKIIDNTLPGWGSWTGEGITKKQQRRQKRFLTKVEGIKPEQRKDAKLKDVIINEKRVRKVCLKSQALMLSKHILTNSQNVKYLASHLPHPFESKQQYERTLRIPIGPEWTTKSTFQDATKPRVLLKQGIIKPMERPLV